MQKSEAIKFESDKLQFTDIEKKQVNLKLSDISSLKTSSKGIVGPIACFIFGIFPFAISFAIRADRNDGTFGNVGTLILLAAILFWIIGIYNYMKLPSSKHYLQIGTRGNSWYFINCKEENLNELIRSIEKYRDDYDNKLAQK